MTGRMDLGNEARTLQLRTLKVNFCSEFQKRSVAYQSLVKNPMCLRNRR